jgi:hypothetical protein
VTAATVLSAVVHSRAFTAVLLGGNLGAAVASFLLHDWRRGVYWLASAICIAMVAW